MTPGMWLAVGIGILHTAGLGILVWRSLSGRALDPMGHAARIDVLAARMLVVETRQTDARQRELDLEKRLIERLDEVKEMHGKMLSHLNGIERRVNDEANERRDSTVRLDQITSALGNFARRFGTFETALQQVIDSRPTQDAA